MGFRSTYISEDWNIEWPEWFRDKHSTWINEHNLIVSPYEVKWSDAIQDIHKALLETGYFNAEYERTYSIVGIHECGGVSKVDFTKDAVYEGHPTEWEAEKSNDDWINSQHGHVYCYGCSDLKKASGIEHE